MLISSPTHDPSIRPHLRRRRGVVLVLILAMLGLLAVIGVTFATLSGQAQSAARSYADSFKEQDPSQYLDYAFDQLINDSRNPSSVIWGHSLKRDMYGNDATQNGFFATLPSGFPLRVQGINHDGNGQYTILTNIPSNASSSPEMANRNYIGWRLRLELWTYSGDFPDSRVFLDANGHPLTPGTFQVIDQSISASDTYNLTLSPEDPDTTRAQTDARPYPRLVTFGMTRSASQFFHFTLDGRFIHAFNGTGAGPFDLNANGEYDSVEANFGLSGLFPDDIPLDEDYDAADLENWFLAIRSADGKISIPSFHRPGVIRLDDVTPNPFDDPATPGFYNDWLDYPLPGLETTWTSLTAAQQAAVRRTVSRFLRPRSVDHPKWQPDPDDSSYKDPVPDTTGVPYPRFLADGVTPNPDFNPNYGKIRYDVDNDNDGETDSVWVDLGFPPFRDPKTGKYYKPLFAFMVEGLNGKIPLNTAGNIQKRDAAGVPLLDHASHIGFSPNEVNPKYSFISQALGTGTVQLQKLLQGFYDSSASQPTAGRWGEEGLIGASSVLFPRAGRTIQPNWPLYAYPYSDDNYGATDFLQNRAEQALGGLPSTHPELSDSNDVDLLFRAPGPAAPRAGILLPSERWRKFVTPIDVSGNGRILGWDDRPELLFNPANAGFASLPLANVFTAPGYGLGFDNRGRHGFYMYYRPPGLPPSYNAPADTSTLPIADANKSTAIWALPPGTNVVNDNTHNLLHGYESWRNPPGKPDAVNTNPALPLARQYWAAMPWDNKQDPADRVPQALPTFTPAITANPPTVADPPNDYGLYPGTNAYNAGALDRDLADEMNLYNPGQADAPFLNNPDLEWLYRGLSDDTDAGELSSRLASLLPEIFVPDSVSPGVPSEADARRARRLFAVESWDLNNFAWSHDNPGGTFPNNTRYPSLPTPPNPFMFNELASASFERINSANGFTPGFAPAMAQRGRRINLNAPLPATPLFDANGKLVYDPARDPIEPVRQKWIRDTYNTLKQILPPKSVDTPEELAQLSQFVLNIVDFRDSDDTITRFVNTDVVVTPAAGLASPRLVDNTSAIIPAPGPYAPTWPDSANYLVQYGMEYPGIAINETLAYSYPSSYGGGTTKRFFLELVNLLTRDAGNLENDPSDNTRLQLGSATHLRLAEWDVVITVEDGTNDGRERPDPYTGQLPYVATAAPTRKVVPLSHPGDPAATPALPPGMVNTTDAAARIPALNEGGSINPFVVGIDPPSPDIEATSTALSPFPTPDAILRSPADRTQKAIIDDLFDPAGPTSSADTWCWVYLRRPAVATMPAQEDPTLPDYNPLVVIDSMRFPFIRSLGDPSGTTETAKEGSQDIWSVQRLQPLRGGQAVPNPTVGTGLAFGRPKQPDPGLPDYNPYDPTWTAYGFSEQTFFNRGTSGPGNERRSLYTPNDINSYVTQEIGESIGRRNQKIGGGSDPWDGLIFNDRDFQSVAELLLVPACPPGLFTKQFVDMPFLTTAKAIDQPPHTSTTFPDWPDVIDDIPPADVEEGEDLPDSRPHVYPFLSEKFYFSADGTDTSTIQVGGPTGGGWHKMLEVFEVPTSSMGSIGPVVEGENRDWYREDRRPGLINPNLIVDEEVFFGLFDDARLNTEEIPDPAYAPHVVFSADANYNPSPDADLATAGLQVGQHPMVMFEGTTRGFYNPITNNRLMKAAFADFLRMRHGNPAGIYAADPALATQTDWETAAQEGASNSIFTGRAEAPFRSLSYPDIRYTIMRPADPYRSAGPVGAGRLQRDYDNGLMPRINPAETTVRLPRTPPMRLFQIPDANLTLNGADTVANPNSLLRWPLDAGLGYAGLPYAALTYGLTGFHTQRPTLADPRDFTVPATPAAPPLPASGILSQLYLGGERNPGPPPADDNREHPAFRTEWLQKIMNLTTVRTHQYAVWVTVGIFEVERPGDPSRRYDQPSLPANPALAYDRLGPERRDPITDKVVRHRCFAIIDRTRATGFNPLNPGDFRDIIVHSRQIPQ